MKAKPNKSMGQMQLVGGRQGGTYDSLPLVSSNTAFKIIFTSSLLQSIRAECLTSSVLSNKVTLEHVQ